MLVRNVLAEEKSVVNGHVCCLDSLDKQFIVVLQLLILRKYQN